MQGKTCLVRPGRLPATYQCQFDDRDLVRDGVHLGFNWHDIPIKDIKPTATAIADCYECKHRRAVPGDAHSACNAIFRGATPTFRQHGIDNGWAMWPVNFDPVWLVACPLFERNEL